MLFNIRGRLLLRDNKFTKYVKEKRFMTSFNAEKTREELLSALSAYDPFSNMEMAIYGTEDMSEWALLGGVADPESGNYVLKPSYFITDDSAKAGDSFLGKPVISLEEAHDRCQSMLILVYSKSEQLRNKRIGDLKRNPIKNSALMELNQAEALFCKHKDDVLSVYDMLDDEISKATYANMILARMGKAAIRVELIDNRQYFGVPIFAEPFYDEVYVDCGAFVGDTIESYLWPKVGIFQKIYAFEPFKGNFEALKTRVERLKREWNIPDEKIELINGGVGESTYQLDSSLEAKYVANGAAPSDYNFLAAVHVDENGIPMYSIDKYFANQRISFLKADIETYEWAMLAGARRVIQRDRPKLAICIYHLHIDMFRIPLKIKQICPDYKFNVRQHAYRLAETVFYAHIDAAKNAPSLYSLP